MIQMSEIPPEETDGLEQEWAEEPVTKDLRPKRREKGDER